MVPVWHEAGELFDAREKAALAWAETVTRVSTTGVPDSAYEAVSAHFDEKELVDLTIAIGLMNAYNRMAISFRIGARRGGLNPGPRGHYGLRTFDYGFVRVRFAPQAARLITRANAEHLEVHREHCHQHIRARHRSRRALHL